MENNMNNLDLIVVGGGITGAGILREAVRNGFRTLLIEQKDFAWGTSSRSSKLVHGGLRYLKEGHFGLTRESVKERERLIREAPGLVEPLEFRLPVYERRKPGRWTMGLGLALYDLISWKWNHRYMPRNEFLQNVPQVDPRGLVGGFSFSDAQVDDARLVMRLIKDAEMNGGKALNYTRVNKLLRNSSGKIEGVVTEDVETGEIKPFHAPCVINATGVWAENLHPSPEKNKHIRPLRGSHLIFPWELIPITTTVSFFNAQDGRALFAIPWEGSVLVGTTDIDHGNSLTDEPRITQGEAEYLINSLNHTFPGLKLSLNQAVSSFAGVRPVVSEGNVSADKESRDHVIWKDKGLVTVTGGKLTTFRVLAYDTLKACLDMLPHCNLDAISEPVFESRRSITLSHTVSETVLRSLWGRYGKETLTLLNESDEQDLETIPGTRTLWAEIKYAAKYEKIRHLDDLLLRRVRIGLLLSKGGKDYVGRIRSLCENVLPWDNERWELELKTYFMLWDSCYSPDAFQNFSR